MTVQKTVIPVSGMHCANCSLTIEKAVQKVTGVQNVGVNFASEKATVEFDSSVTNIDQIAQAINETGYKAIISTVPLHEVAVHGMDHLGHTGKGSATNEPFDAHAHAHAIEEKELLQKLKVGIILGGLVMLGSFPEFFTFMPPIFQDARILMILAIPVEFWVGKTFFDGAYMAARMFGASPDNPAADVAEAARQIVDAQCEA